VRPRLFKTFAGLGAFLSVQHGVALHVSVLHDAKARCTPTRCVCKPWYRVEELTAGTWIEAERAQRAWLAEGAD
jgi:hypothetical protein